MILTESPTIPRLNMKGAKMSKAALILLYEIRKSRQFGNFCKCARVDEATVLKMAKGGYVSIDKVRMVEVELKKREAETETPVQAIIRRVAEAKGVTVERLYTEKSNNKYGIYSDGELARFIAIHIIYKETRLSYRQIAAEVGLKDHTSVMASLERVGGLMDTKPSFRREVLQIQNSIQ